MTFTLRINLVHIYTLFPSRKPNAACNFPVSKANSTHTLSKTKFLYLLIFFQFAKARVCYCHFMTHEAEVNSNRLHHNGIQNFKRGNLWLLGSQCIALCVGKFSYHQILYTYKNNIHPIYIQCSLITNIQFLFFSFFQVSKLVACRNKTY